MRRRLSLAEFKTIAKDSPDDIGQVIVPKGYVTEVEKATGDLGGERRLLFTTSTGSVDRMGDTVNPEGCTNLKSFHKTGVVLWAHDSSLPPIAKPIKAWSEGGKIKSVAEFAPADMDHPLGRGFGDTIRRQFVEGYMKSVSIGFMPEKWQWSEDEGREYGIDFLKWEKLEFSPVPIPANREAIVELAAKGHDMRGVFDWAGKCLDGGLELIVPRELVEDTRKGLAEIYGTSPTISIPAKSDPEPPPAPGPEPKPTPEPEPDAEKDAAELLKKAGDDLRAARDAIDATLEQVAAASSDKPRAATAAQIVAGLEAIVAGDLVIDDHTRGRIKAALKAIAEPAPEADDETSDADTVRALRELVVEAMDDHWKQKTGELS